MLAMYRRWRAARRMKARGAALDHYGILFALERRRWLKIFRESDRSFRSRIVGAMRLPNGLH